MQCQERRDKMTQEELKEYQAICKRMKQLDEKIKKETTRQIEIVQGKVKGSSSEYPYIETHMSIEMHEPRQADKSIQKKLIYEYERKKLQQKKEAIEDYIDSIPDIQIKTIFQYVVIDGKTLRETGKEIGYSKGRISQMIKKFFED